MYEELKSKIQYLKQKKENCKTIDEYSNIVNKIFKTIEKEINKKIDKPKK